MKHPTGKNLRPGVAVLVVLFVIMVGTIISLSFIARSDVELAFGNNMALRTQMDYLAESGLAHAKALITNPQGADTATLGYWAGDVDLQIEAGDDYYDLVVARDDSNPTDRCTYDIQSLAYRLQDGQKTAQSFLNVRLRLDPCIAYWAGANSAVSSAITVNGDVYCAGTLTNLGTINGDVLALGLAGAVAGRWYDIGASPLDVDWPNLDTEDFTPDYYIDSVAYTPQVFDGNNIFADISFTPNVSNPAGVIVCNGNLTLMGNVVIDGTLLVNGDLVLNGNSLTITAVKNFPVLVVRSDVNVVSGQLIVNGLVQTEQMTVANSAADVTILGGLFVNDSGINVEGGYTGDITITAAPMMASLKVSADKWTPIGGAYFKSIKRE
jgi:hypothetical protein